MVIGTGTDILSTQRIQRLIATYGERFLGHWFSPEEIRYCRKKERPYIHYAARLAAKEAVAKAIKIRRGTAISWRDIEVKLDPDGVPFPELRGVPLARACEQGITSLHLSLSHCDDYATATVIAEGDA